MGTYRVWKLVEEQIPIGHFAFQEDAIKALVMRGPGVRSIKIVEGFETRKRLF